MTDRRDRERLVDQVVSPAREVGVDRALRWSPAWHDLDEAGRVEAFEETTRQRTLEAALDARGLSSTAHTVLSRILTGR